MKRTSQFIFALGAATSFWAARAVSACQGQYCLPPPQPNSTPLNPPAANSNPSLAQRIGNAAHARRSSTPTPIENYYPHNVPNSTPHPKPNFNPPPPPAKSLNLKIAESAERQRQLQTPPLTNQPRFHTPALPSAALPKGPNPLNLPPSQTVFDNAPNRSKLFAPPPSGPTTPLAQRIVESNQPGFRPKIEWKQMNVRNYSINDKSEGETLHLLQTRLQNKDLRNISRLIEIAEYSNIPELRRMAKDNFVNPWGILQPEKILGGGPAPFSTYHPKSGRNTRPGQDLRSVINDFQSSWFSNSRNQNSTDVAFHTLVGSNMLVAADNSFGQSRPGGYIYLMGASAVLEKYDYNLGRALFDGMGILAAGRGVLDGSIESAGSALDMVHDLATSHTVRALITGRGQDLAQAKHKEIIPILKTLPDLYPALQQSLLKKADLFLNGTAYERGKIVGDLVPDLLLATVSAGSSAAGESGHALAQSAQLLKKSASWQRTAVEIGQESLTLMERMGPRGRQAMLKLSENSYEVARDALKIQSNLSVNPLLMTADFESLAVKIADAPNPATLKALRAASHPSAKVPYLSSTNDVSNYMNRFGELSGKIKGVPGVTLEGFETRVIAKEFKGVANTRANVFANHDGNKIAAARFGVGGDEGLHSLSSGFGKTAQDAEQAALAQVKSYVGDSFNPNNFIVDTRPVKIPNVLDLTRPEVQRQLGLKIEELRIPRDLKNAYRDTNILGELSVGRYGAIHAPSAVGAGSDIHRLGIGSLYE